MKTYILQLLWVSSAWLHLSFPPFPAGILQSKPVYVTVRLEMGIFQKIFGVFEDGYCNHSIVFLRKEEREEEEEEAFLPSLPARDGWA